MSSNIHGVMLINALPLQFSVVHLHLLQWASSINNVQFFCTDKINMSMLFAIIKHWVVKSTFNKFVS